MRKVVLFTIILLSSLQTNAQLIQKGILYGSAAVGFLKPSTNDRDLNNHPFMYNLKAGIFAKPGFALGIEFQSTKYTEPHSGIARLQQPGSTWTEEGTNTDKFISIGIYSDFYAQLGKKFYLIPGVFVHYLHNSNTGKGELYENGQPIGMPYSRGVDYGYYARMGANITLCYFIKPNLSINLRCVEFELRLRRKGNDSFIAAPLIAGIQYHLKR